MEPTQTLGDQEYEAVPGLSDWLRALQLLHLAPIVWQWCDDQGAASLHEVAENREDLADTIPQLSTSDREKLLAPRAKMLADLFEAKAQARELQDVLRIVASCLDEHHLYDLGTNLSKDQQELFSRITGLPFNASPTTLGETAQQSLSHVACIGQLLRLHVLDGNWQGSHIVEVVHVGLSELHLRHESDGFEEVLSLDDLTSSKYHMEALCRKRPATVVESRACETSDEGAQWYCEANMPYMSERDRQLLRMARSGAEARGSQQECSGCGEICHGFDVSMSSEDGNWYCGDCWRNWDNARRLMIG